MHITSPRMSALSRRIRRAACAAIAGAAVLSAAALTANSAAAAGLLAPATTAEAASAADAPDFPYAERQRLAGIDLAYLETHLVPRGIDGASDRLDRAPAAVPVEIELFSGTSVTLDREDLTEAFGGGFIWSGTVQGDANGFADLVISNDQVTGHIQTSDGVFRIDPAPGAGATVHRVVEIDPSEFPEDEVRKARVRAPRSPGIGIENDGPAAPPANPEAATIITVLMPYTAQAKQRVGSIQNAANLAIRLANRALKVSQVDAAFKLVGTYQVRNYYGPSKKYVSTLKAMTKGNKTFAGVHRQRDRLNADLVALLRTGDELCGIAWYVTMPSAATADTGFSVSNVDCIAIQVVAHEMGHNAGLNHDRYVSAAAPNSEYNFGFVNLKAKAISIMAYDYRCYINGKKCTTVPMFSTPRVKYLEAYRMGIPKGRKGAADNARRLSETLPAVATYR